MNYNNTVEQGKTAAIVSYFTIIGTVIAIFMNSEHKNSFASFHIRQTLGLFLTFFALGYLVGYLNSWAATSAFYLFFFVLWVFGFLGAVQGEMKVVPLIGQYFQKWFKNI
ncbi:DUF4870 domain-containing protein [Flavobacterium sp. MK4S-17]|jgi:uncharacterized membrane protein|uniref:DUF4870 domain-containing protein n=1 Tax=Flavobacterium sp. MK4S-17 TaxID=2543737 RepID=UPI00135CD72E|nr:hypothetical protein [Flavobacterium sp. MK4S-17]